MRFSSGLEMLDALYNSDFYSEEKEIYVFDYNLDHSIAYYDLSHDEFWELKKRADEIGEYVGALLGPGGWICDDPIAYGFQDGDYTNLDWCNDNYDGEWIMV